MSARAARTGLAGLEPLREGLLPRSRRQDAAAAGTLLPTCLAAATTFSMLSYHFLNKVAFGTGEAFGEPPSKVVIVGLTRVLSAGIYLLAARRSLSACELCAQLRSPMAWACCLPYAVGILGCFLLALSSLESLSLAVRNSLVQSRLLPDLILGGLFLGVPVTPRKVAGLFMVLFCVGCSLSAVKQSVASADPVRGVLLTLALNGLSSCTFALQPLVRRQGGLSQSAFSLVCALEVLVLCLGLSAKQTILADGGMLTILSDLRSVDWLLVLAMCATDACYLIVPLYMPAPALMLCLSLTIPLGYLAEAFYFGMPFSPLALFAFASVGLASGGYAVSAHRANMAKRLEAEAAPAPREEPPTYSSAETASVEPKKAA